MHNFKCFATKVQTLFQNLPNILVHIRNPCEEAFNKFVKVELRSFFRDHKKQSEGFINLFYRVEFNIGFDVFETFHLRNKDT